MQTITRHFKLMFCTAVLGLCATLICCLAVVEVIGGDHVAKAQGSQSISNVTELPNRATATSRTYRLADGSLETRIYQTPVNYRDEQGKWQRIDQSLEETASGAVRNGDNSFDIYLPEDLDEAPVKVALEEHWVSQAPLGVETDPVELDGGVATYSTQNGAADIEFTGLADGLKETIELDGPAAPSTYHFRLETSTGVAPTLEEDGSIELRAVNGDLVAEVPTPFMVDASKHTAPGSAVKYALTPDGSSGGWRIAVEADPEWLNAQERSWPVIIDPSVIIPSPAYDCQISTASSNSMCGLSGWSYLHVKANYPTVGEDSFGRTLVRFGLSSIPTTASLTSATIGLHSLKTATNVTRVDLYDVNQSWNYKTSWIYADGNNKWEIKGGDYGKFMPDPTSLTPAERGGSQPGWWNFSSPNLNSLVRKWMDGIVPNNGVLIKLADEQPRVCCIERRVEWESSTGENKPYLSVQYIPLAPPGATMTSPTDGTKTAKRFVLGAAWDHSGVDGVTFQYRGAQAWVDIPESRVIDKNSQTIKWPYSIKAEDRESQPLYWDASNLTGIQSKAKVQIRAVLSGSPGAVGYVKPVEAEINKDAGGPKDGVAGVGPGNVDLLTGSFTVSRTDVSIPAFNSAMEFSRSFSSKEAGAEATGVLGPGWKPASPVEADGGSAWSKVKIESMTESFEGEEGEEGESFTFKWAELTHSEGGSIAFEEDESGNFITPPEMSGYVLHRLSPFEIAFTDPGGTRTVFSNSGVGNEYLPISVAMTGGPGNKTRMIYEFAGGKRRLKQVIAPAAPNINCPDDTAAARHGCRVLAFTYKSATAYGAPEAAGSRLSHITYYAPGHGGPWDVAQYGYDSNGHLIAAWDPRVGLVETYTYGAGGIKTLTPPGQESWTMSYDTDPGGINPGRLVSVKRPSYPASSTSAQTTIRYDVPVFGSGAPYSMGGEAAAAWGQLDLPTDATAIFPPNEVPANPPSSYTRATVYYMDAEGQISNVATPSGAGTSAPSITTTETDEFGNVVRELSAQNRLRALAAGASSASRSREIDTQYRYSKDGTELQEEKGPVHQVRLGSGVLAQARLHRSIQYDANFKYLNGTTTPSPGETKPHLPTAETTGALLANGSVVDKRSTEYRYSWTLRKPTETITDPGGSEENKSIKVYDEVSGLPTEVRQPKNAGGGGAGTTKIVYFKVNNNQPNIAACESDLFAGLPCKIEPAAQPGIPGQPQLLVRKFLSYNQLGQPLEATESPGGGAENVRKYVATYDAAGRQKTTEITGGGTSIPKVETLYSGTLGFPTTQRFVCPASEPACDTQATSATYDTLGRETSYSDADGSTATTTYNFLGRPVSVNDGKRTHLMRYDSVTGLLVELEEPVSGVVFTASYDADGQLVKRALPNGLTAQTTFDETGSPMGLTYTKTSNCGASCTWLDFTVERSINGQILLEDGTLGKEEYGYDKLGRLTSARETPAGGPCTTRTYKYDKNSNREEMTTTPGLGGVCSSSGGTTQKYTYDSADRLLGEGLTYDAFGRITNLPAVYAGGKALATTYFGNDMVATQSQNGITNSFQLDAALRHRQRLQAGGLEGTEIFHYAGSGDSPAWTQRGSIWTRSITGIGGELVAIQEGPKVELQLTNLHGDVVAKAASDPAKTSLLSTFRHDEFGAPVSGAAGRFGWLGGKQRRTELPSGVIQMGARSYVPSLGRFLTPDPILGGAANPYDYANQDPINEFDLEGTCSTKKKCAAKRKRATAKVQSAVDRIRDRMRKAREARNERRRLSGFNVPEILPWEKEAQEALRNVDTSLIDIFTKDCGETSNTFFAIGGTATSAGLLLSKGGPAAAVVGGMLGVLGAGAGIAGGVFWGADKANVC